MSKDKNSIPELRFPEFKDKGKWKNQKLSSLANRVTQKNKHGKINRVFTNSANDGIVEQSGYFDRQIVTKNNLNNYYIVEDGDYIYNPRISKSAPVGPTSKNKTGHKGVMSPLYTVFRFKNDENSFFEYYFQSSHWAHEVRKAANTGARYDRISIKADDLINIQVWNPISEEQEKIASSLSTLDELISSHTYRLELLEEHKKGLIQNLFPEEGESMPKLRFPEFKNDDAWDFPFGNELFKPISNKNHKSDLPILAITQDHGAIPRDLIDYTVIATEESIRSYKVVEIGDFIISLRSFQGGIEFSEYKGICSPAYIILRKKKTLHNEFYKHYFKSHLYIKFLNRNLEGIRDGKMISYTQFSEITLPFPSMQEQKKIASCLSAIDELISAQQEKIEELQQHKKGLMQGLFPKIES